MSAMKATTVQLKQTKSDGLGGQGIVFEPITGKYSNVVIWMHGLGDTADGWASLMPSLNIADTKFVLPTAQRRPISINGGMAMPGWSDIYGLHYDSAEDKAGMDSSADRINKIIAAEVEKKEIKPSQIVVAGFSQGGALALHTTLRSPVALGGCVALSTWLPFRHEYPAALSPSAHNIPILQIHGDADQVVSLKWGEKSHEILKGIVSPVPQLRIIDGMGHSSDPEEIDLVREFLSKIFSK
eukprot:gene24480-32931_t